MKKIMRKLSALLAAAVCAASAACLPASAMELKNDKSPSVTAGERAVWKSTKELAGASYSSNYIKWLEKYSAKDAKSTVKFKNSETKKFFSKYRKIMGKMTKDDFALKINIVTDDEITSLAIDKDSVKAVIYSDGMGMAVYSTPEMAALVSVNDKEYISMPSFAGELSESYDSLFNEYGLLEVNGEEDDYGIDETEKGKRFRIRSGDKVYIYEEFNMDGSPVGFLFTEKGTLVGMSMDGKGACVKISLKVDGSEFRIPKGYKEMPLDIDMPSYSFYDI